MDYLVKLVDSRTRASAPCCNNDVLFGEEREIEQGSQYVKEERGMNQLLIPLILLEYRFS